MAEPDDQFPRVWVSSYGYAVVERGPGVFIREVLGSYLDAMAEYGMLKWTWKVTEADNGDTKP